MRCPHGLFRFRRPARSPGRRGVFLIQCASVAVVLALGACAGPAASAQDDARLSDVELRRRVRQAIQNGTAWLRRTERNGRWPVTVPHYSECHAGMTALAVLAQINCDIPIDAPPVARGLEFLRRVRPSDLQFGVYEASLIVMALAAADDGSGRDLDRIRRWAVRLQESQITAGINAGLWPYDLAGFSTGREGMDRSNGQFAVLALRDAAYLGVDIDPEVWKRVQIQWDQGQNPDGGWGYRPPGAAGGRSPSTGSMTAAGLATVAITTRMIPDDSDVDHEGRADCCRIHQPPESLVRGHAWLSYRAPFSIRRNPGHTAWHFYYLYGLERAGRLTGVRFFGDHDWYRAGSRMLVSPGRQNPDGSWTTITGFEQDPVLTTSFALLFLSKGLSRIVVNKLDYTSTRAREDPGGDWNRHYLDIPNLIDHIDTLPGWPPRLNSQVLTLSRLEEDTAVLDMNQAPVLYISGRDAPAFSDDHVRWFREYIDQGGFIFAQAACTDGTFDAGIRQLVRRMFPDGEASLKRLEPDHPVFRSEYLLQSTGMELYGVDFGCRTPFMYSPEDHACYWHRWMRQPPRSRSTSLTQRIERSMRLGVNVIAYATGREPPEKLNELMEPKERIEQAARSVTEIAQLRHSGGWETAPRAVSSLLQALQENFGTAVSTAPRSVPAVLEEMSRFPLLYMHGRYGFRFSEVEIQALRDYLSRGPVLIADACCGSERFDRSFRELMNRLYPDHPLEPIPAGHEMFQRSTGYDVTTVRRRRTLPAAESASLRTQIESGPPLLEGIRINGQYVVIYSRYDLSCALENQASLACDGYVTEDAVKLAVNIVMYALFRQLVTVEPAGS